MTKMQTTDESIDCAMAADTAAEHNYEEKSYSASTALIEQQERAEFAKVKLTYRPQEFRPGKDAEYQIRGRIKGMFRTYCEQRSDGRCNMTLLQKILYQFSLYRIRQPHFYKKRISCFEDLRNAVAALPEPKRSTWNPGKPESSTPTQPEAVSAKSLTLPVRDDDSCPF